MSTFFLHTSILKDTSQAGTRSLSFIVHLHVTNTHSGYDSCGSWTWPFLFLSFLQEIKSIWNRKGQHSVIDELKNRETFYPSSFWIESLKLIPSIFPQMCCSQILTLSCRAWLKRGAWLKNHHWSSTTIIYYSCFQSQTITVLIQIMFGLYFWYIKLESIYRLHTTSQKQKYHTCTWT